MIARQEWEPHSLFPEWLAQLTLQQQAVLMASVRGQDGDLKNTGFKQIMWTLRATIMKAAHTGQMLKMGEHVASFMTLRSFEHMEWWENLLVKTLEEETDSTIFHYYTHLMHAAEVLAYKHPDPEFRTRWFLCYKMMVHKLHLNPETEAQMDARLSDWDRDKWATAKEGSAEPAVVPIRQVRDRIHELLDHHEGAEMQPTMDDTIQWTLPNRQRFQIRVAELHSTR